MKKIKKLLTFFLCFLIAIIPCSTVVLAATPKVDSVVYVAVGLSKSIPCSIENCKGNRKSWSGTSQYFTISSSGTVKGISQGSGTATVSTEAGEKATCTIKVTPKANLSANKTSLTLQRGKTETISVSVSPNNACKKVVWNSSNTNVATVSNGKITAKGIGSCTITCKTDDGGSGQLNISVVVKNVTSNTTKKTTATEHTAKRKPVQTTKKTTTAQKTTKSNTTGKESWSQEASPGSKTTTQKNNNISTTSTTTTSVNNTVPSTTDDSGSEYYYTGSNEFKQYEIKGISQKKKPITIEWNSVDNASGYQLFCSFDAVNFALIYDGTNNQYEQHHFQKGTTYYYFVRSYKIINGVKVTDYNSETLVLKSVGKNLFETIL